MRSIQYFEAKRSDIHTVKDAHYMTHGSGNDDIGNLMYG